MKAPAGVTVAQICVVEQKRKGTKGNAAMAVAFDSSLDSICDLVAPK